jgi:hypothetical protein
MANTTFPDRLAYLVWLQHLRTGDCPSNTDIAKGVGLTQSAISQWWGKAGAPTARATIKALLAYFDVQQHEDWIADGKGEPPRAEFWLEWWATRHPAQVAKGSSIDHTRSAAVSKRPKRA